MDETEIAVSNRAPVQMAGAVLLAGLVLTALLAAMLERDNHRLHEQRLTELTNRVQARLIQRFGLYEYGLRGARGAVVAAGGANVTRDVFARYSETRDVAREFPGALGFGFIRRVPIAQEADFLARARAEGPAEFRIRELAPHDGDRFVIQYIYPAARNTGATGLDVASEVKRRDAALAAARDDAMRLTAPLTLVQASDQPRRGFIAFLPVYRDGASALGGAERESAAIGWTYVPLLLDSVLSDLGDPLEELGLTIRDAAEATPFFESAPSGDPLPGLAPVEREIEVHGRRWQLRAYALPALAAAARPVSVTSVVAAGAALSLVLAAFTWTWLQRRTERGLGSTPQAISLKEFLASPLARWGALAYGLFMVLYAYITNDRLWTRELDETRRLLVGLVDQRVERTRTTVDARRGTLKILAETPAALALRQSAANADLAHSKELLLRQQQVFFAQLRALPEVYLARLIGTTDGGKELVRVERRDGEIVSVEASSLRREGDQPYVQQTLTLPAGDVWVSAIDLHREEGRVSEPHRPTVRYATPLHDRNGKPFGIIVMNVDVGGRMNDAVAAAPRGGQLLITNADGDYLAHPNPALRFGFDLGQRHRWQDDYSPLPFARLAADDRLRSWTGPQGPVVAATASLKNNGDNPIGTVHYTALLPQAELAAAVRHELLYSLVLPSVAGLVGGLLLFLYWGGQQRQLLLRSQQLKLAAFVDQSLDAIVGLDAERRVTAWNRGAQRLFGATETEAVGQPLATLVGADPKLVTAILPGSMERTAAELDCRSADGRLLRVAVSLSAAQGASFGEALAVLRDVTDEREAQERIVALNQSLESQVAERTATLAGVLRAATELSIIATDQDGLITLFNTGAEQMLGYRADELVGRSTPAPLHVADEVQARGEQLSEQYGQPIQGFRAFVHVAELLGAEQREWTYVRKDGSRLPVSLVVTAMRNEEGTVRGYLGIAQDITARQRAEAALRESKVAAESANAAKSLFLANMSHEIRTPMNAVLGVAHLLEDSPLDADQRRLLGQLQIAGRTLRGLIDDVLDLSKIEAGEMQVVNAPMDLGALLADLLALFGPQAQAKDVMLSVMGLDELPPKIVTDALRLRQILVNLLSNALKFTAQGAIRLRVSARSEDDGRALMRWSVEDTGTGIRAEALPRLFEAFVQEDATTTRRFGGTGLGLAIVRRLAELMGGTVGVRSTPGVGSEFWVDLPLLVADEAVVDSHAVLLVVALAGEDTRSRQELAAMCQSLGWRTQVWNAASVSTTPPPTPDIVLACADAGESLAAFVAENGEPGMLPWAVMPVDFNASMLFNVVNQVVAERTGNLDHVLRATRMDTVDVAWLHGLALLVVDDSEINREVAARLLTREGASVVTAADGQEAVELLAKSPEGFDAVLMDVQMPRLDGYAATRHIRQVLGLEKLPVLALTAGAMGDERQRALASGMNAFVPKPLDPVGLLRAVRHAVEEARGQPLPVIRAASAAVNGTDRPAAWPEIDGIDTRDAVRRVGHNLTLFRRLLARMLREFPPGSFSGGSSEPSLIARLHKLRGSAGMLGATRLHRLIGVAEDAARADPHGVAPAALLAEVDGSLASLASAAAALLAQDLPSPQITDEDEPPSADLAGDISSLLALLRQQDLSAGQAFRRIAPALERRWGKSPQAQVAAAIDELDFGHAVKLVEALCET